MINKIKERFSNIRFYEEKKRFLLFSLFMLLCLYLAFKLFGFAYASYQSSAKLNANIDRAIYLIDNTGFNFNIDFEQIVPSIDPYIYKFSVSNFNASLNSDIDIEYGIKVTTTTNLPLTFSLYRNENYDANGAVNLFSTYKSVQDIDGAWYNIYEPEHKYVMEYSNQITDIYTLVIYFPKTFATNMDYANAIENIEVEIKSKQIVG